MLNIYIYTLIHYIKNRFPDINLLTAFFSIFDGKAWTIEDLHLLKFWRRISS